MNKFFQVLLAVLAGASNNTRDRKHIGSQTRFPTTASQITDFNGIYNMDKLNFNTTFMQVGNSADRVASRKVVSRVKRVLEEDKIPYEVFIPNLYEAIVKGRSAFRPLASLNDIMDWTAYRTYDEIMNWMDSLEKNVVSNKRRNWRMVRSKVHEACRAIYRWTRKTGNVIRCRVILEQRALTMKRLALALRETLPATDVSYSKDIKYAGAQLFRVTPRTPSEVRYLRGLYNAGLYDFFTTPRIVGKPVQILATPWMVPVLKKTLIKTKIDYKVMIADMYQVVKADRIRNEVARAFSKTRGRVGAGAMDWTSYHTYDEIMTWVDSLATTYPNLVTVEDIGYSYEGRVMKIVKVSTGGTGKPAIFSDAGTHAREWISSATLAFIMNELLSNSASYQSVLDIVDFYFIPLVNPDGYAFSFTNERLWRKTRSPTNSPYGCAGVDPNRNWDFHWMESGASQDPCTEIYAGSFPFSEVECRNVRDQILRYTASIYVYLAFHSFSQIMIYPWGYDKSLPPDWRDLHNLAIAATDALTAVHGTQYRVGSVGTLLYPAAGGSDDWAKGVAGIKYAYTMELRPSENSFRGHAGFELPPSQIIPTGEENFAAFEFIMNFVRDTFGKK